MMDKLKANNKTLSVLAFSFLFAYLLSFLFEGTVLYKLLDTRMIGSQIFIPSAIIAHFLGQFTCGIFCKSSQNAKRIMITNMIICLFITLPFFFTNTFFWLPCIIIGGYASGCTVAAWGYFLKTYTPKNQRIKTCADVLIFSNIIMIIINVVTVNFSVFAGLVLSILSLAAGMLFTHFLPVDIEASWANEGPKPVSDIRKPMGILFLFVAIITIDSGLMYQVINPGFAHLTWLTSWYWAIPYIVALAIMRNLPVKLNRTTFLYVGMSMIMCAFLGFMVLGRGSIDYLIIDTLMLGACGIFDLFWWSIIGETLDYARNPVRLFGVGLSANVFGVLCGAIIGMVVTSINLPEAQIAVIALCVVCVTLIILPPLNNQFTLLLKTHAYLSAYSTLTEKKQQKVAASIKPLDPLTERESELLRLVLEGKTNKEIANISFISENTVKTHLKSIYSKYAVASRTELISLLLRSQDH